MPTTSQSAISIRLPKEMITRLDQLATATGRSKTYYVTEAIKEHLDDLEDIYLAERRLEDVRAGRSDTVSLADLVKRYGMAD